MISKNKFILLVGFCLTFNIAFTQKTLDRISVKGNSFINEK